MDLRVNEISTGTTSPASEVKETSQKNIHIYETQKKQTLNDELKRKEAENQLLNQVSMELDLDDNFIIPTIVKKDGKNFVRLKRLENDKIRSDKRQSFNMGALKKKLGINDGILTQYNNLADATGRSLYTNSDSGTLEPGKFVDIPIEELGQAVNMAPDFLASIVFKKLRQAVENYKTVSD